MAIRHCLENGGAEAVKLALKLLSEVIRAVPLSATAPLLSGSGVFSMITKALEDEKQSGVVLASHLEVLARIMLTDSNIFLQLVQQDAAHRQQTEEVRFDAILDATWASFDYAGESRQRKVIAMAMASLLPTVSPLTALSDLQGHHLVLERLRGGEIRKHWEPLDCSRQSMCSSTFLANFKPRLRAETLKSALRKRRLLTIRPAARGVKEAYAIGLNDPQGSSPE